MCRRFSGAVPGHLARGVAQCGLCGSGSRYSTLTYLSDWRLTRELGACEWAVQRTPPAKVHGSIVFAPAGRLVPEALRVLERGGAVALAGVTMTPIPELDYDRRLYWERGMRSVAHFAGQDAEELRQVAAEIPIQATVHTFPLEAVNEALPALKRSETDGTRVLIVGR
jgi:propanol-preferring alcohol dehydrogenase